MSDSIDQLQAGAGRLAGGIVEFRKATDELVFVGAEIARNAEPIQKGAEQLAGGLANAGAAQEKLQAGS